MNNKKKILLELSDTELEFLRDLLSVQFDDENRVSVLVAEEAGSSKVEKALWHKVYDLCSENEIAVDEAAPDYVIKTIYELSLDEEE